VSSFGKEGIKEKEKKVFFKFKIASLAFVNIKLDDSDNFGYKLACILREKYLKI
jgi:hypothetical protein